MFIPLYDISFFHDLRQVTFIPYLSTLLERTERTRRHVIRLLGAHVFPKDTSSSIGAVAKDMQQIGGMRTAHVDIG